MVDVVGDLLSELRNVKYVVFEGGWLSRTVAQRAKEEIEHLEIRLSALRDLSENLRAEADTAFLEGVKAGLEAAAQWADREKATYVKWVGQCAGHDERYMAADAIRAIDPATITREEAKPDAE